MILYRYIFAILFALFRFKLVTANTETFKIDLPAKQITLQDDELITNPLKITKIIDLRGDLNYNEPFKFNIGEEVANNSSISIKLVHDRFHDSNTYIFKLCWSAIVPISYTSSTFSSYSPDNVTTIITFKIENDSYPSLLECAELSIACSVSKLYLSIIPMELAATIAFIIIILTSLFIMNKWLINFYDFFKNI